MIRHIQAALSVDLMEKGLFMLFLHIIQKMTLNM